MNKMEYEKDLGIDPFMLDEEWLRQPGLFMKYSEAAAEAQRVRDLVKEKVDVIKAELDQAIRKDPAKFGLEKLTETVVAGTILLQPKYVEVADALVEANFKLNILQSAVRAFDHRRSALENVVKLWLGSYFSGPKTPRDIPGGRRIIDMTRDKVASQARGEANERLTQGRQDDHTRRRRG
ncbi:MAG: hypothetical protein MUP27_09010 [Desulfobacterales bacterium]|nr:hypothetical protein [Desulfobacterales bacterium]